MKASVARRGAPSGATRPGSTKRRSALTGPARARLHRASYARSRQKTCWRRSWFDARRGQLRQQRSGIAFDQLCEEWYEYGCYQRDWSPATRRDYRSVLDAHLIPAFGSKRPEAITTQDVEQLRDRLAYTGTDNDADDESQQGHSRRTVNKILTQLHGVLQYAVRRHKLLRNVVDDVDLLEACVNASIHSRSETGLDPSYSKSKTVSLKSH